MLALAVVLLRGQGNGPLNPPAAPADGVYRTLNELYDAVKASEPRTPIVSADLPLTIDQPGSYYLAENLTFSAATGNAITVSVNDVTIDLNGFTLSSEPAVTGNAIHASVHHLMVRNGTIRGNTGVSFLGIDNWLIVMAGFNVGINGGSTSEGFRVVDVTVKGCRNIGINAGRGCVLDRCSAFQNGGHGIVANGGPITRCVAGKNGSQGIDGRNCVVSQCSSWQNEGIGIRVQGGGSISNCLASENFGSGLDADVVVASVGISNGSDGMKGGVVSQSSGTLNGESGIQTRFFGGSVSLSTAINNDAIDIDATGTRTGNTPAP